MPRVLRETAAAVAAVCVAVGCAAHVPSQRGPGIESVTPEPAPSSSLPAPSASDAVGSPASWYDLSIKYGDAQSLEGFVLAAGTLDGRNGRTVSKQFGPLSPSSQFQSALPNAAGPFGDDVLYAFWDGSQSELRRLSVTTGTDALVLQHDGIIHAVTLDEASGSIYLVVLDADDRLAGAIHRLDVGSDELISVLKIPVGPAADAPQVWRRLWTTPDQTRLVLVDCPSDCKATVIDLASQSVSASFQLAQGLDVVGVTDQDLVAIFGCDPPCAASTYDLQTGAAANAGTFCELATLVTDDGEAKLISDRPLAGDCRAETYAIGMTDLGSGDDRPVAELPDRTRTLVQLGGEQGTALPEGWVLVGPGGRLTAPSGVGPVPPASVRLSDGALFDLPLLGT